MAFDQSDLIYSKQSWQQTSYSTTKIPYIMLYLLLSNFDSIFNLCDYTWVQEKTALYLH